VLVFPPQILGDSAVVSDNPDHALGQVDDTFGFAGGLRLASALSSVAWDGGKA